MLVRDFLKEFDVRSVYHFTAVENLPLIREHGLLSRAELVARGINPPKPGGDMNSGLSDDRRNLGNFVHLCFRNEHPMEYVARRNGRLAETAFLRVSAQVLLRHGVKGCDGLVNRHSAQILPLADALDMIDLEILFGGVENPSDPALRQRRLFALKAEILVPDAIEVELIEGLS